jgi:CheY-like chemotaxis protein
MPGLELSQSWGREADFGWSLIWLAVKVQLMPKTALYVEDEKFDVEFMRIAFEKEGLQEHLQVVMDGQHALDYLSGSGKYSQRDLYPFPSVVLLDLNLPGIPGFMVLKWAREQAFLRGLPIVVFSSSKRDEDRQLAMMLGAADYISKPNSGKEFYKVVRQIKQPYLGVETLSPGNGA